jgi:hypothetical protein
MVRKALRMAVVLSSMVITEAAIAQDGGIWASRPRARRVVEESVPASALPGLAAGLAVRTGDGKAIGRISQVVTGGDGSIRKVIVVSPVGNLFKLSPTSLTVANGVVITTEARGAR